MKCMERHDGKIGGFTLIWNISHCISCISHCGLDTHAQCDYSKPVPITTCFYYTAWHQLASLQRPPSVCRWQPFCECNFCPNLSCFEWPSGGLDVSLPHPGLLHFNFSYSHILAEKEGWVWWCWCKHSGLWASSLGEASKVWWGRTVSVREFESLGFFALKRSVFGFIIHSIIYYNTSCLPHIDLDCSPETVSLEFLYFQPMMKRKNAHTSELSIIYKKCFLGMVSFITLLLPNLWLLTQNKHTEALRMNDLIW